ncbi:MAG: PepSY domain-containing protein [Planctomycetaceae bacterium]|nr:PepSY domain-containing protein [Planctomycetaceae bacterium]
MKFSYIRRICYEIHLWLGIVSGIVVSIVCLSGGIYAFREEVARIVDPHKYYVKVPSSQTAGTPSRLSADDLVKKLEADNPGQRVSSLTIPDKPNRTITATLSQINQDRPAGGFGRNSGRRGGGRNQGQRNEPPQNTSTPTSTETPTPTPTTDPQNQNKNSIPTNSANQENKTVEKVDQKTESKSDLKTESKSEPSATSQLVDKVEKSEPVVIDRNENEPRQNQNRDRGENNERSNVQNSGRPNNAPNDRAGGQGGGRGGRGGGGGGGGMRGGGQVKFINPYNGEVVGEGENQELNRFFRSVMMLHRNLWIDSYFLRSDNQPPMGGRQNENNNAARSNRPNNNLAVNTNRPTDGDRTLTEGNEQRGGRGRGEGSGRGGAAGGGGGGHGRELTTGRMIVGIATLVFIFISLTGLVLWLPRNLKGFISWKFWKSALTIRVRKGFWPFIYDMHNTVGFYTLIPILILALTGLCWTFEWYRNTASWMLDDEIFKQRQMRMGNTLIPDPIDDSTKPLSIEEIIKRTEEYIPGKGEVVINIPNNKNGVMLVQKGRTGFLSLSVKDSVQWDRYHGKLVPFNIPVGYVSRPKPVVASNSTNNTPNANTPNTPNTNAPNAPNANAPNARRVVSRAREFVKVDVNRFSDKTFREKIALSVRSLHFGDITGLSSKLIFGISCLLVTTFPITGVMIWIRKLNASRKQRKKAKTKTNEQENPEPLAESA